MTELLSSLELNKYLINSNIRCAIKVLSLMNSALVLSPQHVRFGTTTPQGHPDSELHQGGRRHIVAELLLAPEPHLRPGLPAQP
jgi:hypothetical protein